jgi:hypothetical protein
MNENDEQIRRSIEKMSEKELLRERDRIEENLKYRRWIQTGAMVVGLIGAVAAAVTGNGYLFPLFAGLAVLFLTLYNQNMLKSILGGALDWDFLKHFGPLGLDLRQNDSEELERLRIVEHALQNTLRAKSPSDRSYTPPPVQGGPAATA